MVQVTAVSDRRIRQGDVFRDIDFIEHVTEADGVLEVSKISFPLVVVLTQDCDLEQDFKYRWSGEQQSTQDKWLLSVLVAPLYNAEHVYDGSHLSVLDRTMEPFKGKKTKLQFLHNNQIPRYHFLPFPDDVHVVNSVVDFKHYFSVNVETLKALAPTRFVCSISQLYREDISHRFASFLSRIGLPDAI
jgi:hypothetical protein